MLQAKLNFSTIFLLLLSTQLIIYGLVQVEGRAAASDDGDDDDSWGFSFTDDEETKQDSESEPKLSPPLTTDFKSNSPNNNQNQIPSQNPPTISGSISSNSSDNDNITVHSVSAPGISAFGSSNGNFNDSCDPLQVSSNCNDSKGLKCNEVSKRCLCDKSNHSVFVKSEGKCLVVSARATGYSCIRDEQCHEGSFGPYSLCNSETNTCECMPNAGNREIIKHNEKCFIRKELGAYCTEDEECEASISGKSICIYKPSEYNGTDAIHVIPPNATKQCLCDEGFIFNNVTTAPENRRECLKIAKDESSRCSKDIQCTSGLGPLSRCFQQTCQCADVVNWKGEAVLYKGKCYVRLGIGDPCENDVQCHAGIHENAVCVKHESYLEHEKVCICPEGKKCDGNGAGSILVSMNLFLMGFTATRILNVNVNIV